MLSLTLALVLSAAGAPPVSAWADKACPPPKQEPRSNIEFKAQEGARAECLRRAMNKALDKVLLPLKKKDPAAFKQWMALQADYNRWMADACAAVEEAHWVDTATGERFSGTGYGSAESQCRQRQYAWRGFSAEAWARGDAKAFTQALEAFAKVAPRRQEELHRYREQVRAAAARPPAPAQAGEAPPQTLSQGDWQHYSERLERAATAPRALAERQCALLPKPPASCAEALGASLLAQMDFSEVLGGPGDG